MKNTAKSRRTLSLRHSGFRCSIFENATPRFVLLLKRWKNIASGRNRTYNHVYSQLLCRCATTASKTKLLHQTYYQSLHQNAPYEINVLINISYKELYVEEFLVESTIASKQYIYIWLYPYFTWKILLTKPFYYCCYCLISYS